MIEAQTKKLLIKKFDEDIRKRSRLNRFWLVFDQMMNVVFFNGSQDETVSSNIGRHGTHRWLCKMLVWLESKHCKRSIGE